MSRYFEVSLDDLPSENVATKPLTAKKLRIQKRNQIRSQKRNLARTIKVAKSTTKEKPEVEYHPVDKERVRFYSRGDGLQDVKHVKTKFYKQKLINKEKKIEYATELSARAELLLTEDAG